MAICPGPRVPSTLTSVALPSPIPLRQSLNAEARHLPPVLFPSYRPHTYTHTHTRPCPARLAVSSQG